MKTTFDQLTQQFGQDASRRQAVKGLAALAFGSLGLAGFGQAASAKTCKQKCKDQNCGTLSPKRCNRRCRQRCRGKD
jgi:hypothetical protein